MERLNVSHAHPLRLPSLDTDCLVLSNQAKLFQLIQGLPPNSFQMCNGHWLLLGASAFRGGGAVTVLAPGGRTDDLQVASCA